jgi:NAD-dependent SIR2 family protein deacetylase
MGIPQEKVQQAADAIRRADAILIGAGAGMGVDSGLPDFRGTHGFWEAYPPYKELGLSFVDLANPTWFERDPHQAWGFYGHRLELYRRTRPHEGFKILKRWGAEKPNGHFVLTSNVDGHFQQTGFESNNVLEVHGSLNHLQCVQDCGAGIWSNTDQVVVDAATMRAKDPLPLCSHCSGLARPNVLMFNDWSWDSRRTDGQHDSFQDWLRGVPIPRLVVIELGAGTAVPTVRSVSQGIGGTLIRINPREPEVPDGGISLGVCALEALEKINSLLHQS